jgi:hypothetical protein
MELTAAVEIDDLTISVDSTAYRELSNGDKIILVTNYNTYEEATIGSFTTTSITVTSALTTAFAVGKKVYPMMTSELVGFKHKVKPKTPGYIVFDVEFIESLRYDDI